MTTCIILAAGESQRFGSPKALAEIQHKTVLDRLIETVKLSQVTEILAVTGAHEAAIKQILLKHKTVKTVHNKYYKLGQTSSLKTALLQVDPRHDAVLFVPVDCPLVRPSTFDAIIHRFKERNSPFIVPTYQGRRGHPPLFHFQYIDDFLSLQDEEGANKVFHKYEDRTDCFEIDDPGITATFNTPEEFDRLCRKFKTE